MTKNKRVGRMDIIEKRLGIPADYQFRAIRSTNWLQKNWHKNKYVMLENVIAPSVNQCVLDLGTGSGNFELLFSHHFGKITGVDYNDEALTFLKSQLDSRGVKNVSLVQSDIRNLPVEVTRLKYDMVVIVDTIEHIGLDDAEKLICQINKILKIGGKLIVITPNYRSSWQLLERILDKISVLPKFEGAQHLAKFYPENLREYLSRAGYKRLQISTFNLFSYIFPTEIFSRWLLRFELRFIKNKGCLLFVSAEK